MKISPARVAAFDILYKIETEKAFSSVLLPLYEEKLEVKDRALCHTLTLGVLRKQIYLDCIIDKLAKNKKIDSAVRIALRLGIFQLLFLDKIPDYSAVSESVNLVQRAKKTSAKGFVNALLRRVLREPPKLEFTDEIERLSVEDSHPRRLLENWIRQFGIEETEKLVEANNRKPRLVFRLTRKADANTLEILTKIGLEIIESTVVPNAFEVSGQNEILFAMAQEGKIYFQDESSQLVASMVVLKAGEKFLDVCAAPGSKTTLINFQSRNTATDFFVAGDFYEHRLKVLQANCRNQSAENVNILAYNALAELPFAANVFDVVLVDAPCSGTGTIRHNPEIRYFVTDDDIAELSGKQLKILINASKTVKSGGRLVYSTCSLERSENETVCERFLIENPGFTKIPPETFDRFLTAEGFARTFPGLDGIDGFFIAVFQKL